MTDNCIIGPLRIPAAHLEEDNTFADGTEEFKLVTSHTEALQLQGLASKVKRDDFGNTTVISTQKSGWGLIPLDTSVELEDNEDWTHRGYYLIDKVEPEVQRGMYMLSKVSGEKVANYNSYLTMNYTPGYNDGTVQPYNYEPTVGVVDTLLDDHFTQGGTAPNWCGPNFINGTTYNWYGSGDPAGAMYASPAMGGTGKCVMSGVAPGNGRAAFICYSSAQSYSPPWTAEWNMEWTVTPTDGNGGEWLPSVWITWSQNWRAEDCWWHSYDSRGSIIRFYLFMTTGGVYLGGYVNLGGLRYLWDYSVGQLTSSQKNPRLKVEYKPGGILTVWADKDGGSNWTKMYGPSPCGQNFKNPSINIGLEARDWTHNAQNLNKHWYCDEFKIYKTSLAYDNNNNVIALPAGEEVDLETTASFNRSSEDGNIPMYVNPTTDLEFKTNEDSFYSGSVKAYSNNYTDDVYRQITRADEVIDFLTLPCMYVKNGIIKLEPTDSGVNFYYWDNTLKTYVLLNTFYVGDIKAMKMTYVSPERCSFKINDTIWTVMRGKPFFKVEHPTTDITYTKANYYVHDGATASFPAPTDSITMGTTHYTNIYNSTSDTYRAQIYQVNPTTITAATIPKVDLTGIGVYNNTELSTSYNHASNIAKEFLVHPRTSIGVKY